MENAVCQRLSELRQAMGVYAAGFDPALISACDAGLVVEHASAIEKMAATVKALAAARGAQTSLWRSGGDSSAAKALARRTGTSVGAAAAAIKTAKRLKRQPKTAAAARQGELSPEQASVISEAVEADPGAESKLLATAKGSSLAELKDECARVRAAADEGGEQRHRRIHRNRYLRRYTDAEGAGNIHVRNTVEMIAAVMSVLGPIADRLGKEARAKGEHEADEAYAADALNELARMAAMGDLFADDDIDPTIADDQADSGARPGGDHDEAPCPAGSAPGPAGPTRSAGTAAKIPVPVRILVRADLDALLRGYPHHGRDVRAGGLRAGSRLGGARHDRIRRPVPGGDCHQGCRRRQRRPSGQEVHDPPAQRAGLDLSHLRRPGLRQAGARDRPPRGVGQDEDLVDDPGRPLLQSSPLPQNTPRVEPGRGPRGAALRAPRRSITSGAEPASGSLTRHAPADSSWLRLSLSGVGSRSISARRVVSRRNVAVTASGRASLPCRRMMRR